MGDFLVVRRPEQLVCFMSISSECLCLSVAIGPGEYRNERCVNGYQKHKNYWRVAAD